MGARGALLAIVALLYLVSIPWYRSPAPEPARILGLPDWVAVAVGCYALAAVLNALAWWVSDVDEPPGSE